jgi:hypothetical protein
MTPLVPVIIAALSAGLPTQTVLVCLLINNQCLSDFEKRMDRVSVIEQVLDARLKHLEEHL